MAQPLEQLNLPGVIDVVEGHAGDEVVEPGLAAGRDLIEGLVGQTRDRLAQLAVHACEQGEVLLPGLLFRVTLGPAEPVAPLRGESTPFAAAEAAQDRILPIGGVDRQLPDVVAVRGRPPGRLLGAEAAERSPQVGAVPRLLVVGLIDQAQEHGDAGTGRHMESIKGSSV